MSSTAWVQITVSLVCRLRKSHCLSGDGLALRHIAVGRSIGSRGSGRGRGKEQGRGGSRGERARAGGVAATGGTGRARTGALSFLGELGTRCGEGSVALGPLTSTSGVHGRHGTRTRRVAATSGRHGTGLTGERRVASSARTALRSRKRTLRRRTLRRRALGTGGVATGGRRQRTRLTEDGDAAGASVRRSTSTRRALRRGVAARRTGPSLERLLGQAGARHDTLRRAIHLLAESL